LSLSFHSQIFFIMALTAYQQQFKRRMKRAISLRAKADQKARRYAQLLADAIGAAENAAAQMDALNQLYNVDVSTYTLLTQALHTNNVNGALVDELAQSSPGEEAVLYNQVPDGNGGQPLPANPLFGEVGASTSTSAARATRTGIQPGSKDVAPKAPAAAPATAETVAA
jgi:hypothetical protein